MDTLLNKNGISKPIFTESSRNKNVIIIIWSSDIRSHLPGRSSPMVSRTGIPEFPGSCSDADNKRTVAYHLSCTWMPLVELTPTFLIAFLIVGGF